MPNWYVIDTNGNKSGLINDLQLKSLVARGSITPDTPLETECGHKGLAGQIPGLFPAPVNPSPFVKTVQSVSHTANPIRHISVPDAIRKINLYFTWFWVCILLAIPTFGLAMIPAIVFSFLLHYQLWKVIPSDIARTTPGRAVGFCFIPIFHFYWLFVTCVGLCKDMNKTLRQRGFQLQISEGLALTYCIFYVIYSVVLFVMPASDNVVSIAFAFELLLLIGLSALLFFFYKSIKNGAIILLGELQPGDNAASIENKKSPITHATSLTTGSLYCTNCGNSIAKRENTCMSCGADPIGHKKFCRKCGIGLDPEQVICVQCKTAIETTLPPPPGTLTANNQSDVEKNAPKQKCHGIGGLLIVIGIILFLIGSNMERHNRFLLEDLNLAERELQHIIQQSHGNLSIQQRIESVQATSRAAADAARADMAILKSAHSPDLILLIRGLGGFLLLFGFVLVVVGWILPQNKP